MIKASELIEAVWSIMGKDDEPDAVERMTTILVARGYYVATTDAELRQLALDNTDLEEPEMVL